MSSEQTRLQVPPELFGVSSWMAHTIRLLVRQQKMHRSRSCYGELEELTIDDFWQFADAGDQELDWHTLVDKVPQSLMPKTTMDCHSTDPKGCTALAEE